MLTNKICRSSCRKPVTQTPGCGCVCRRAGQQRCPSLPRAPGQGMRGFLRGINVAVVQLRVTSAPQQNYMTREGMQPKIVNTQKQPARDLLGSLVNKYSQPVLPTHTSSNKGIVSMFHLSLLTLGNMMK